MNCSDKEIKNKFDLNKPESFVIAHAGGKLENHIYTNSLEALNHSFEQGCRLLELDISETSDGKLVALHDWKTFKEITNYQGEKKGEEPLTEQEVLNSKIHGKFTPLNMDSINKWFQQHPEAILVTDKINDPKRFTNSNNGFKFKNRLLMELFSWDAIDVANEMSITPIASQNLVFDFEKAENRLSRFYEKRKTINKLEKKGVRYVCYSYHKITYHKKFVNSLKENGFLSYVYSVNSGKNDDEQFIYDNYGNVISGMYADDVNFLKVLKNLEKK